MSVNIKFGMHLDGEYTYKLCMKYYLENSKIFQFGEVLRLCTTDKFNVEST